MYDIRPQWVIVTRIHPFYLYQNRWPWLTLNCHYNVFVEIVSSLFPIAPNWLHSCMQTHAISGQHSAWETTLCLKKVPTFKLSVTLSNLNRFSKSLHCWNAYEIWYKTHSNYLPTLGMLLHYLGKLKIQIFCRYSAHMGENTNKLHIKCTDFNSPTRVTVYSECIHVVLWLSKSCSHRWIPCWLLTNTSVTSAVTNFRCPKLIAKVNK